MKYKHEFTSENDNDEHFELTFEVVSFKNAHTISEVQVYQPRGDLMCKCQMHHGDNTAFAHVHAQSMYGTFDFNIDIYVRSNGCEIIVIEKVVKTISHIENLQPCKTV